MRTALGIDAQIDRDCMLELATVGAALLPAITIDIAVANIGAAADVVDQTAFRAI